MANEGLMEPTDIESAGKVLVFIREFADELFGEKTEVVLRLDEHEYQLTVYRQSVRVEDDAGNVVGSSGRGGFLLACGALLPMGHRPENLIACALATLVGEYEKRGLFRQAELKERVDVAKRALIRFERKD